MPASQLRVSRNDRRKLGIDLFDIPLDLIETLFVLTLEERQRHVLCLILKRDLITDQAIASADQFRELGLLWRTCRAHGRPEHRRHAGQDYRINSVRLGESACRLCEPPRASRVELNTWQIRQSLLKLPVVGASSFIGDPIDLPLPKPIYQFPVAP
ncbi:hypothetical protein [Mesorhizobium sp. YR577]|uniref:hypothetical protein n=1 Tax=Mesorhizobium sp. YR577 TaxID=1884373 RepID=UPI001FCD480A|nr:hypothetical protein [Mesorhizobium sp. YR577]